MWSCNQPRILVFLGSGASLSASEVKARDSPSGDRALKQVITHSQTKQEAHSPQEQPCLSESLLAHTSTPSKTRDFAARVSRRSLQFGVTTAPVTHAAPQGGWWLLCRSPSDLCGETFLLARSLEPPHLLRASAQFQADTRSASQLLGRTRQMLFLQKLSEPLGTQKNRDKARTQLLLASFTHTRPRKHPAAGPGQAPCFNRAMTQVKVSPAPQGGE